MEIYNNRYSYAFNNPLSFTDPSGWWPEDPPEDYDEPYSYAPTGGGDVYYRLNRWYNGPADPFAGMGFDFEGKLHDAYINTTSHRTRDIGMTFDDYYFLGADGKYYRRDWLANEWANAERHYGQEAYNWLASAGYDNVEVHVRNAVAIYGMSMSTGNNIYEPGSSVYNFSKAADIRQEGIGLNASYSVTGGYRIYESNGIWKVSITGVGHTAIGDKYGVLSFSGGAELLVNGQSVNGLRFVNSTSELYSEGSYPMGMATFQLPKSGNVQLRITASYSINTGAGILAPIPISIPQNYTMGVITIPFITTIRMGPAND